MPVIAFVDNDDDDDDLSLVFLESLTLGPCKVFLVSYLSQLIDDDNSDDDNDNDDDERLNSRSLEIQIPQEPEAGIFN